MLPWSDIVARSFAVSCADKAIFFVLGVDTFANKGYAHGFNGVLCTITTLCLTRAAFIDLLEGKFSMDIFWCTATGNARSLEVWLNS